jgi:hypothetical protein
VTGARSHQRRKNLKYKEMQEEEEEETCLSWMTDVRRKNVIVSKIKKEQNDSGLNKT